VLSPSNRAGGRDRRRVLRVEGLETRELLSLTPFLYRSVAVHQHSTANLSAASIQADAATGGSITMPTGQPTPQELARQRLSAKLSGTYQMGPGRFTSQAAQVLILAVGNSNTTLHVNIQMAIFTPSDPVNGATLAEANLSSRNVGSSGSTLDLLTTTATNLDALGVPTHYTWTVGPSSGGLYSNATGGGTIDIDLIPNRKAPRGATSAGRAFVVIQGSVNTSGIFNDLAAPGNRPHRP
jgi:hypothetical protein